MNDRALVRLLLPVVVSATLLISGGGAQAGEGPGGAAPARDDPGLKPAPDALRVLYVEGAPRWEYRYLKNLLVRDRSFAFRAFLASADAAFVQEASPGLEPLGGPPGAADLAAASVLVLGDLEARDLSPDLAAAIRRAVEEEGLGLLVLAGAGTRTNLAGTAIGAILPVEILPAPVPAPAPAPALAPVRLVATAAGLAHPAFADPGEPPARVQARVEALPPLYGWVTGVNARPHATVLATVPVPAADGAPAGAASTPVLVVGAAGRGRVAWLGTDEIWRYRAGGGDVHARFFRGLVRDLAPRPR